MAPVRWSDLPGDVLLMILKLIDSEIDLLRLRSVCSSWRSSLPTRTKPYSFPMKVPPLPSVSGSITQRSTDEHASLCQSSLYRISLPEHVGDPSDGWLLRVSEVRPNTFSLLSPLLPERIDCPPDVIPKGLNLLDLRISEICKCYHLTRAGSSRPIHYVKKAIVLSDFLPDCDFAVLAVVPYHINRNCLSYWKFGDEFWTPVDTKNYLLRDVILFDGKCYAVGLRGELVSFDSEFNMTLLSLCNPLLVTKQNHFVVHKSDLYIVAKSYFRDPDSETKEAFVSGLRVRAKIVTISNGSLTHFEGLKHDEFFLSSNDLSVALSTKDFGGCKGNCVYIAHGCRRAVFDFDTLANTSLMARDRAKIYWPPPDWVYHNSIQDPHPVHE